MNRRWNRLTRFERLFFLFVGLINVLVLCIQFFYGSVFSWWLSGVGNGFYLAYAYLLFSKHNSGCPIENCSNVDCPHYSAQFHTCIFTEVPIDSSTLGYWIRIYAQLHGVDALSALVSDNTSPEVSGDA